jgi:hypothetical protein
MSEGGQDLEPIAVIQSAIEEYAQELALVVRRFLKAKAWDGTERIAMGGGFRESHIGELAIARANLILKADGIKVDMVPIHNDPDEAALIGACISRRPGSSRARQHPGDRHRRHEYPRRRGAAERRQGERPHQGVGVEIREMASRRRRRSSTARRRSTS